MTYQPVSAVEVFAWGQRVGVVARNPETGLFGFRYDPDWVERGIELSPLKMPRVAGVTHEFGALSSETFLGLPPLLADSLPDRFGNALVDAWMAEQGLDSTEVSALDRLAYAADRTMGALTYRPPARSNDAAEPTAVQMADLVLAARLTIAGDFTRDGARDALTQLLVVGTSAGGNRAKAVVSFNPDTYQVRSPYAEDLPKGFEPWIVKLDGVSATGLDGHGTGLARGGSHGLVEYAYHLMAVDAGIDMTECRILREGERSHFMTRRFDRTPDGERLHILTLCGLAHLDFNQSGAHSYDQYLDTIDRLGLGADALAQGFRRMVFNVVAVNRDDHTKNFSFMATRDGTWTLSPAYDLSYAYNPRGRWTHSHQMSVNGSRDHIGIGDLEAVGERHHVPAYRRIIREVRSVVANWEQYAAEAGVGDDTAHQVAATLADVSRALAGSDS